MLEKHKIRLPFIYLLVFIILLSVSNIIITTHYFRHIYFTSDPSEIKHYFIFMFLLQFVICAVVGGILFLALNLKMYNAEQRANQINKELENEIELRIQIQTELRNSELRYKTLMDFLPQIVCEIDTSGKILYANHQGFRISGYTEEDLADGLNVFQMFSSEDHPRLKQNMAKILYSNVIEPHEYTLRKKDGTLFPILSYASAIIEDGVHKGFRGLIIDISDIREIEKKLVASTESFYNIVESTDEGIIIAEENGIVRYLNNSASKLLSKDKSELIDTDFGFPLVPGKTFTIEILKEGMIKEFVELHVVNTHWHDEKAFLIILRNITEKRKAEEALIESEEKLQTIISDLPVGIIILDKDTHEILDANPQALMMIGSSLDDVVGKVCHKFICPADSGKCPVSTDDYMMDRSERVMINALGESIPILKTVVPINLGGKMRLLESFLDISELKKAEKKIVEQNEFLNNVLESLTHPFYVIDANDYTIKMGNSASLGDSAIDDRLTCHKLTHRSAEPCCDSDHPCPLQLIKETKKPVSVEHIHYDKDNNATICEVHGYPVFDNKGELTQIIEYSLDITQRKLMEAALEQERDRAQQYLDIAGVMLVALNCEGEVSLINKKGSSILGYDEQEIVGMNWFDSFIPENDRTILKKDYQRLLSGDLANLEYYENIVVTKNGELREIAWHNNVLREEGGEIYGTLSSGEDITERKKAELALKESEEKFRRMSENIPVVTYSALPDETSTKIYISSRIYEVTGYRDREFYNDPMLYINLLHPQDKDIFWNAIEDHRKLRTTLYAEYRIIDKFNQIRWVRDRATPVVDESGSIIRIDGFIEDITERKKTADAIRESEKRFERAVRGTSDAIWEWNIQTNEVWYAPRVGQQLGYESYEFPQLLEAWSEKIHPDDKDHVFNAVENHFKYNTIYDVEYRIKHKNGEYVWMRSRGIASRDKNGKPEKMSGSNQDITDRKKAEQEIMDKENYLRTILTTIHTGVILSDEETAKIIDVNPYAIKSIGKTEKELIGDVIDNYIIGSGNNKKDHGVPELNEDYDLKTIDKGTLNIRLSRGAAVIKGHKYSVNSFLDISDIKNLLEEQKVNIELAKKLLNLINLESISYADLGGNLELFIDPILLPCKAAGGDHFLAKKIPGKNPADFGKTFISLKDQSGHEVNCVLKAIVTDMLHNSILCNTSSPNLEEVIVRLNNELCRSELFESDDFVTCMNLEIDNNTLDMKFISSGHPQMIIIRNGQLISLPDTSRAGQNLPLGTIRGVKFTSGKFRLQKGDKVLMHTDGLTDMPVNNSDGRINHSQLREIISAIIEKQPDIGVSDLTRSILRSVSKMCKFKVSHSGINTSEDDVSIIGMEIEDTNIYEEEIITAENHDDINKKILIISNKLSDKLKAYGFHDSDISFRTVFEEGVINAWKHGNHSNPEKEIKIRWRARNDFHLQIIDQGEGFNYKSQEDPTSYENRLKLSGRGIYMMKLFAEKIRWRENGRNLTASFRKYKFPDEKSIVNARKNLMKIWKTANY